MEPKGYKRIGLSLDDETIQMLDLTCKDMGISRSAFLTMMIRYTAMAEKLPLAKIVEMVLTDGLRGALKEVKRA